MRSSLFSVYVGKEPVDETGVRLPGYIQLTADHLPLPPNETHTSARHVFHAAPGVSIPENVAEVVVDGSKVDWKPAQIAQARADYAPYLMEATWVEGVDEYDNPLVRRGKMIEIPQGVQPLETNLLPHLWAGE